MTPGWWFEDELKRTANAFDPERWSGDRREIEASFGELEIRLQDEQRMERAAFVKGYDQRAIDQATGEILARLKENMGGLSPEQQWGSQEAMNQVRDGVRRDLAVNPEYQRQRSEALSELSHDQADQLQRLYDREAGTLQSNGFEQERETAHTDALLHMGGILSDTRQGIERLDELSALSKAETGLEEAKVAIDAEASAKAERRRAFFGGMDRIDRESDVEQERQTAYR